jgi:NADH dehydrogenase
VVIVGGGFGGLYCAQSLRKAPVEVTLIDRRNFHLFQPLLYQVAGHPAVFVIGDLALAKQPAGRTSMLQAAGGMPTLQNAEAAPLPGLAPVAMQEGHYVAKLIRRRLAGGTLPPFRYRDRGSMATIGRARAVAMVGPLRFSGILAWLMWLFIHLMYIVEFQNRLLIFFQWAWPGAT